VDRWSYDIAPLVSERPEDPNEVPANDAKHAGYPAGGVVSQTQSPTFSDALALVRKELWAQATFRQSPADTDTVKVSRGFVEHLTETLCYAAYSSDQNY
jgi:hypothetical protein